MMCAGKRQICAALNDARSRQPCRRGHMIKKVPSMIIKLKLKFLNDVVLSKDSLLSIIHSEALKWFKTRRVEHPQ